MKLIDILVMISKGELKEGTKVNLITDDYTTYLWFDGEVIRFVASDDIYAFTCKDINDEDEYELIETEEEIEELDKEEIMHLTLPSAIAVITDTLNKIIQKIKKEDKQ